MQTLTKAIDHFLVHCRIEKNLSPKTIKAYQIDLKQVHSFFCEKSYSKEVNSVSKVELRNYLESIGSLKPKSIKRKIATLKALFNFLEFEDMIITNPLRKMRIRIREEKKLPRVLNIQEMGSLFRSAYASNIIRENTPKNYSYFESLRNIVIVELLFATGARVSEIANLKDGQINVDSGEVRIKGKGNKERVIQICNPETLSVLRHYRVISIERIRSTDDYFLINRFNNKISDQSIRNLVRNLAKKADIQTYVTPHVFRHSFATLLLEKDVDIKYIQSLLGHSSIMTTQLYTHVNREKQKQILQDKHPRREFSSKQFVHSE